MSPPIRINDSIRKVHVIISRHSVFPHPRLRVKMVISPPALLWVPQCVASVWVRWRRLDRDLLRRFGGGRPSPWCEFFNRSFIFLSYVIYIYDNYINSIFFCKFLIRLLKWWILYTLIVWEKKKKFTDWLILEVHWPKLISAGWDGIFQGKRLLTED